MRFLITGGAGFIGSHIVERLLQDGHFVRVLDNFSSGKPENLYFTRNLPPNTFELIKGDIRDFSACLNACDGIDYVLHQAALRSVPKSMENPYSYNEVNINGTLNMLKAAKEAGVKRFVFASSSSIYGDTDKFPQEETDYPLLISPYALTKLAGEYYCRIFSQNYGLETVSLRYFNVFGPRQSLDDEYAVVIPKFVHCILNGQSPPIHGTGKQSRDFTYIDNVVQANILGATVPSSTTVPSPAIIPSPLRGEGKGEGKNKTFCEVFNVACGKEQSILNLVDTLNEITGKSIEPIFTPPRAGDVLRTLADISKVKQKLGYEPKVDFKEGLRRTVIAKQRGVK